MTTAEFLKIGLEKISQVYQGKDNHCRCGCGGEYTATSFMEDPRSPVDDALVAKKLERAKKLISSGSVHHAFGTTYVNVVTGKNRALCFYFDELKK
jgi:hypothetical protein